MDILKAQILVTTEGIVLQVPNELGRGMKILGIAPKFCKNPKSNILALEDPEGKFDLFGIGEDKLYVGPKKVSRFYDSKKFFVYLQEFGGEYFEESFDGKEKTCLGERTGNFFLRNGDDYEILSYYDKEGSRVEKHYISHEFYVDSAIFERKDGYYDIYNPEDFVYRDVFRISGGNFTPAVIDKQNQYQWHGGKINGYKKLY